jgi:uncharacterized membrane protein
MDNPILAVVMRYLHIVAAVLTVGGMSFILFCVTPASRLLDEGLRESFLKAIHGRFMKVIWAAIATLIITGAYSWMSLNDEYRAIRPWGQALIGTKALLAAIMFVIVWLRSMGIIGQTPRGIRRVLMANVHLAGLIILLATILRYLRMSHGA